MRAMISVLALVVIAPAAVAQTSDGKAIDIWPNLAPGETTRETGEKMPIRQSENPPVTRVINIRKPTLDVYAANKPNGVGVLILPGGGFGKVVPDMEGSEAATILNKIGISAFVLNYRTMKASSDVGWKRPLQDAQRAMSWVRSNRDKWHLHGDKIGILGFSAGGQVAARLLTDGGMLAYERVDDLDRVSHRPDFALLIYPWNMYDKATDELVTGIHVSKIVPPTFIVHTHDDASTSLGSVLFYVGLKKAGVDAELHVYQNGGHGYGTRPRPNSNIGTWPDRMVDWLRTRELAE